MVCNITDKMQYYLTCLLGLNCTVVSVITLDISPTQLSIVGHIMTVVKIYTVSTQKLQNFDFRFCSLFMCNFYFVRALCLKLFRRWPGNNASSVIPKSGAPPCHFPLRSWMGDSGWRERIDCVLVKFSWHDNHSIFVVFQTHTCARIQWLP